MGWMTARHFGVVSFQYAIFCPDPDSQVIDNKLGLLIHSLNCRQQKVSALSAYLAQSRIESHYF